MVGPLEATCAELVEGSRERVLLHKGQLHVPYSPSKARLWRREVQAVVEGSG